MKAKPGDTGIMFCIALARPSPVSPGHSGKRSPEQDAPGTCVTSLPTGLLRVLGQEGLWVPPHPLLLRNALFLAGWGPSRGWMGGLLDIAGLSLTPASFTGWQTCRLTLPVSGLGQPGAWWLCPVLAPGRFSGTLPSPHDHQALEDPGTWFWRQYWCCAGRPRSLLPQWEEGRPWPPVGCGRWQRQAGWGSTLASQVGTGDA